MIVLMFDVSEWGMEGLIMNVWEKDTKAGKGGLRPSLETCIALAALRT